MRSMLASAFVGLVLIAFASAAPVSEGTSAPVQPEAAAAVAPPQQLESMDLGLTVFDQNSATSVDQSKNYVILAFDTESCSGSNKEKCQELESALAITVKNNLQDSKFDKFRGHLAFGKANKDDFPEHKKEFEKAKVPLPAVLFWPAGHSRPSCKFDTPKATGAMVSDWLFSKLKEEEDDDLLELDEGEGDDSAASTTQNTKTKDAIEDVSLLVCQANGGPNLVTAEEPTCGDLMEGSQGLMQLEKTQKIWSYKEGKTKLVGPADNSLPHDLSAGESPVVPVNSAMFGDITKKGKYSALYFSAPWCKYCGCLEPVWSGVAGNLVGSERQPYLTMGTVDGDANPELRSLLNVTVYPTFLVINKDGTKVLGRYLGPRKVFELSNWIEDLIVADENPIVKHQFEPSEQGEHTDLHPVYPYTGPKAFGGEALAVQNLVQLTGNDMDECLESDEAKFTAPGAALLVHYDSVRSLEFDIETVNTEKVPDKATVIDFYAPWCPHCQKLNPIWDTVTEHESKGDVVVGKVDVEAHPNVKQQFGIKRFPTIMYFPPGQKMSFDEGRRYKGQRDVQHLEQWIDSVKGSH